MQSQAEFIYKGLKTSMQYQENDIIKDVLQKYAIKISKKLDDIYFLHNGEIINEKLSFKELNNKSGKIEGNINKFVYDKDNLENLNEKYLKKSKIIICPICYENINLCIKNYKIILYGCKYGHMKNMLFNKYEKTQFKDESKIKCVNCKKNNKGESFNNKFLHA